MEIAHESLQTKDKQLENIKEKYNGCDSEEQRVKVEKGKNVCQPNSMVLIQN